MTLPPPLPRTATVILRRVTPQALLLAAVAASTIWGEQQTRALDAQRTQTLQQLLTLQATLTDVVELETSLRGFVLSGHEGHLVPYRAARLAMPQHLAALAATPGGEAIALDLRTLADDWIRTHASPAIAERRRTAHLSDDEARRSSEATLLPLRTRILTTQSELHRTLHAQGVQARRMRRDIELLVLGSLLAAVGLLLAAILTAARGLARNFSALASAASEVAHGRFDTPMPTGHSRELDELARDLHAMAVALAAREARLEASNTALARTNTELQRFAHAASHDLQEPLRTIVGFAELLERKYGPELPPPAQGYVALIVRGGTRMRTLVQNLLDFARTNTPPAFGPVDLNSALAEARANLDASLETSGAVVEVGALPTVHGDRAQLVRTLGNLLSNAVKYVAPGQVPHVQVWAEHVQGAWELTVRDHGIGIDPAYAERLFVPFARLHNHTEYPGTGLGLALARRVMDEHGGSVTLRTPDGPGCAFTLRFAPDPGRGADPT